jgi:pimeloyl-ACP methyl ester carboxylesterase
MAGGMQTFRSSDGLAIAYDAAGEGEPVVLVHGLGLSRRRWDPVRAALLEAGYRVARYDLRGFGDSELPDEPYPFDALVDDFRGAVAAFGLDDTPFHLVGHSVGGMIAQRFAIESPAAVRTLTLCSTTAHCGRRASAFARALSHLARHGYDAAVNDPAIRAAAEDVLRTAFDTPPPLAMFRRGLEEPNPAQAFGWLATAEFSTKDELGAIRCPALVLHGTADPVIPVSNGRALHGGLDGARYVEIDGAGHHIPVEHGERLATEVLALLASRTR